jgi:hypothetical protein
VDRGGRLIAMALPIDLKQIKVYLESPSDDPYERRAA